MSYCRWSSDDSLCDLYCYEHADGGFITHVAKNRWTTEPGLYGETDRRLVPIGLQFDGESFTDPDLESFLARLIQLATLGYQFPSRVIETVKAELEEERKEEMK